MNLNEWTEDELLLHLAAHLCGRALLEWGLIDDSDKTTYSAAVENLKARLDPGSCTVAAQDFRHTHQGDYEEVSTFIRKL